MGFVVFTFRFWEDAISDTWIYRENNGHSLVEFLKKLFVLSVSLHYSFVLQ